MCQPFGWVPVSFTSGGPYGPRGVFFSDFEGGPQGVYLDRPKYTYYKMYMFPNLAPERARRNPPTDIFLPIIGSIYPIQTYKLY